MQTVTPVTVPEGHKQCSRCGVVQPLGNFAKHSSTKDKKQTKCKACGKLYRKHLGYSATEFKEEKTQPIPENVALPRTFMRRGVYTTDGNAVYRNDGNKHILSKGLQT